MRGLLKIQLLLLLVGLLSVRQVNAQNRAVDFLSISFDEALKIAESQDKIIFIDCYIDGCKPCKMMAENVFKEDTVADFVNSKFVSLTLNMFKSEGSELRKRYGTFAYPTYLFIDGSGKLLNKFVGGMAADKFIARAQECFDPNNRFLSSTRKFASKNYDHAFMRDYIHLKFELCEFAEATELANQYFEELTGSERSSAENWFLYGGSPYSNRIAYPNSPVSNYLVDHWADFKGQVPDSSVYAKITENFREITRNVFNGRYFSAYGKNAADFDAFTARINKINGFPGKSVCVEMMDIDKAVSLNDTLKAEELLANYISDFDGESQTVLLDFLSVYLASMQKNSNVVYEIMRNTVLSSKNESLVEFLKLSLDGNDPGVEKYDVPNLESRFGQKSIVPFFHPDKPICYFSWHGPGEKSHFLSYEPGKGTHTIYDKREIDSLLLAQGMDTSYVNFSPSFDEDGIVAGLNSGGKNLIYNPGRKSLDEANPKQYKSVNWGLSPDGKFEVFVKSDNLYLRDLKDSTEQQLTSDGDAGASFQLANLKWLSDKGTFVIYRENKRGIRTMTVINSVAQPFPIARNYEFELPGDDVIESTEVYFGDVRKAAVKQIDVERWKGQQLIPIHSAEVKDQFYFLRVKRTRNEIELCSVNEQGELKSLVHEVCEPLFNDLMFSCKIINGGNDILFWSDRSGWGQYYRYDKNGQLNNPLTTGKWTAGRIAKVDEKKQQVYLYGYGREEGRNPNYSFLYRVDLDGKNMRLLTPEDANHNVFVHSDANLIVDNYSRIDLAPQAVARNCDGALLDTIITTDIEPLLAYGWKYPDQFTVKAADGKTDLYGIMWKPFDFDPNKKYPIISQVYPGPFTETVWTDFTVLDRYNNTALAQRGFIVVCMGHRGGSPVRSKAYASYGHGNLRDYPLEDDKYGLEQLARRFSFIDSTRVGIVGHSGGALMSVVAMCTYPDFYKVTVASSGNYDNYIYHRNWGEFYQGIGEDNSFSVKTAMELAPGLKGKLLLVTGESDDNVNPSNTYRMVDALIKANKGFDMMVLPGQNHHYEGPYKAYFEKCKRDYFSKYLAGRQANN
ncbi:prolyl oligopeptidase family serine peptidase [Mangrovibacterium lignilyticum]|uniref:prolyl oligopeptidase family serine peptidase n=1 Tax=Mangrovibacterium lignilyticum TaxID=2668052 RepID=UPI0013D31DAC|nr:prolyl oligopeptidase family serine peptidase [Mangrovibacterium lignilyticum]